ncbi:MAG: hypothetical protein JXB39_04050 [Deltaproteobacteria bacterium]|nr:hypothetical protein [Deltaproteobacteria bacterium]
MTLRPSLLLLGLPLVLGCPPLELEETGFEADADADADADSDADADADTDADVDAPVWEGQIHYQTIVDGKAQCDAVIALLGTPYTGPCVSRKGDQCDFGYDILSTLVKDNSTPDCGTLNPSFSFLTDQAAWFKAPVLAYWDAYTYAGYDFYTHLLVLGYAVDYTSYGGGYYPGPYWSLLAYDGHPYGSADIDYPALLWDIGYTTDVYDYYYNYYTYCPGWVRSDATKSHPGKWSATGQLDTTDFILDVWSFTVPDGATDPLHVFVDTEDKSTGCDMGAFLNRPDGCSDVFAHGNADCTYPPYKYLCPVIDLDPPDTGTYQLVLYATGYYSPSSSAAYRIVIDAPYDPEITPLADDIPFSGSTQYELSLMVSGWGQPIED